MDGYSIRFIINFINVFEFKFLKANYHFFQWNTHLGTSLHFKDSRGGKQDMSEALTAVGTLSEALIVVGRSSEDLTEGNNGDIEEVLIVVGTLSEDLTVPETSRMQGNS